MGRFAGKRETSRREDGHNFARLLGNARDATTRALEQIADDWDCTICGLAGISKDAPCPTCNP